MNTEIILKIDFKMNLTTVGNKLEYILGKKRKHWARNVIHNTFGSIHLKII